MNAAAPAREAPAVTAPHVVRPVSALVDPEWIAVSADLQPGTGIVSPWRALLWNAELAGPAKLVLPPGARNIEIRAELPVDDGADVDALRDDAETAVNRAAGIPASARHDVSGEDSEPGAIDLCTLAAEAGWPFVKRASGRIAIDLDVPNQFCQAIVEPRGAGCRARVMLALAANPSEAVRSALAVLLLTVTASVRMVRAGAAERQGETAVFAEADVAAPASAQGLRHALAALAVACRMAGREAKALADERVADLYLAARGWAACP